MKQDEMVKQKVEEKMAALVKEGNEAKTDDLAGFTTAMGFSRKSVHELRAIRDAEELNDPDKKIDFSMENMASKYIIIAKQNSLSEAAIRRQVQALSIENLEKTLKYLESMKYA